MNERIWELFRQANHPHPEHGGNDMFFPEEFAELIVKECGVALSPMLRDMISRGQAYDIIKEHFGVEE
jgi:hypothetical protein